MIIRPVSRYVVALGIALSVWLTAGLCAATLMVDATVQSLGGGLFHYDYSITNTMQDVSIVSITDAPTQDVTITNTLAAPTGFLASYDPNLGIVDFLENTNLFGMGTTVNHFQFDSAFGPDAGLFSTFTALTTDGLTLTGAVQTQVVPEPGTLVLLALGLSMLTLSPMRKRLVCQR